MQRPLERPPCRPRARTGALALLLLASPTAAGELTTCLRGGWHAGDTLTLSTKGSAAASPVLRFSVTLGSERDAIEVAQLVEAGADGVAGLAVTREATCLTVSHADAFVEVSIAGDGATRNAYGAMSVEYAGSALADGPVQLFFPVNGLVSSSLSFGATPAAAASAMVAQLVGLDPTGDFGLLQEDGDVFLVVNRLPGESSLQVTNLPGILGTSNDSGTSITITTVPVDADCDGDLQIDYFELLAGTLFDVNDNGVMDPCEARLIAAPGTLSLAAGGTQDFTLNAGADNAGALYWILGSASGTAPGLLVAHGVLLPLNVDPYFFFTLTNPLAPIYTDFVGFLDAGGDATAALTLPPASVPSLVGVSLHHSAALAQVLGEIQFASNATLTLLIP